MVSNVKRSEETRFESKFDFPNDVLEVVKLVYGEDWSSTVRGNEINGVLGIAIVKSILNGSNIDIDDISRKLRTYSRELSKAFSRLSMNGAMLPHNLSKDTEKLNENDVHTWCHYAAIAAGHVGIYR